METFLSFFKEKIRFYSKPSFSTAVHINLAILSTPIAQFSTQFNYLKMFIIISCQLSMTCKPDCNCPEMNE